MIMSDSGAVLGQTPLQSFKGSNFSGVPQPKLSNDTHSHDYTADATTSPNEKMHILITAATIIVAAYIVWHVMYER